MIVHEPAELATLLDMNAPAGLVSPQFDAKAWLEAPGNLALRIGTDLGMFEFVRAGVYGGHIWFSSRGTRAFDTARAMLEYMFTRGGAVSILGETPVHRRDAWMFVRKLGFRKVGERDRPEGRVILSHLKREGLTEA